MEQLGEFHKSILTNPCNNSEKSKYQFLQIHVTTHRNPCNNFDTRNFIAAANLGKIIGLRIEIAFWDSTLSY